MSGTKLAEGNQWYEVPGNPGMILIGNDDLKIPVYCEPGEKTVWRMITTWNEVREFTNKKIYCYLYRNEKELKVYYQDSNEEFEIPVREYDGRKITHYTVLVGKGIIAICNV